MSTLVSIAAPVTAVAGTVALVRSAVNLSVVLRAPPSASSTPGGRSTTAAALVHIGRAAARVTPAPRRGRPGFDLDMAAIVLGTRFGRLMAQAPSRGAGLVAGMKVTVLIVVAALTTASAAVAGTGLLPVGCAAALAAPHVVTAILRRSVGAARRRLLDQAPVALDVMAAVIAGGGTFETACRRATSTVNGPCAAVLDRAVARMAAGETAPAALARTAAEAGAGALAAVFSGVARDVQLGVAVAPRLARAADSLRADVRETARLRAARGSVVATLITALVIAPACACALLVLALGGVLSQGLVPGSAGA